MVNNLFLASSNASTAPVVERSRDALILSMAANNSRLFLSAPLTEEINMQNKYMVYTVKTGCNEHKLVYSLIRTRNTGINIHQPLLLFLQTQK